MRRNFTSQFAPVTFRSGVTASEIVRNTRVSMPVVRVTNSSGFAPTRLCHQSHNKSANGTSALMNKTTLKKRVSFTAQIISTTEDTEERQKHERDKHTSGVIAFLLLFCLGLSSVSSVVN